MSDTPLSDLVRSGCSMVAYTATDMCGETHQHNVLLNRQDQHRILTLRKKMIGEGIVASEQEV